MMLSIDPAPEDIQRIYCLMLAEIGDILVTTPALAMLRELYPKAEISLIVRSQLSNLVAGNPHVDHLILYKQNNVFTKIRFLVQLFRRKPCDLWVDLHTPTFNTICSNHSIFKRNHLIKRFTRPKYSVGYQLDDQQYTHTHPLKAPDEAVLATENIVATTTKIIQRLAKEPLESSEKSYEKFFPVSDQELQWASDFLAQHLPHQSQPIFGLFFGSKQPADVWPTAHCQVFIRKLFEQYPKAQLMILGGPCERNQAQTLINNAQANIKKQILNLAGKTSFGQTGALMQHCQVLVSTDSGPLHIADALKVPTVALFSSKNHPAIWRPSQTPCIFLNHSVPCGPCFRDTCNQPTPCISMISPEQTLEALTELFQQTANTNSMMPNNPQQRIGT